MRLAPDTTEHRHSGEVFGMVGGDIGGIVADGVPK